MSQAHRSFLCAIACAVAVAALVTPALAGDAADKPAAAIGAEAVPADQPAGETGGCPYAAGGQCCEGCQQKAAAAQPAGGAAPMDCPCKRRLQEGKPAS